MTQTIHDTIAEFEASPDDNIGFAVTRETLETELAGDIRNLPPISRKHLIVYDPSSENYLVVGSYSIDEVMT